MDNLVIVFEVCRSIKVCRTFLSKVQTDVCLPDLSNLPWVDVEKTLVSDYFRKEVVIQNRFHQHVLTVLSHLELI